MTIEEAREIIETCDDWYSINHITKDDPTVGLDGAFTIAQLEAFIVVMKHALEIENVP